MQVSIHAKTLIHRLLHRDPKNRLGSQEGANEIKHHPFFKGVNWALVRTMVTLSINLWFGIFHFSPSHILFHKINKQFMCCYQNPPDLDAPLFGANEDGKEVRIVDPALEELHTDYF